VPDRRQRNVDDRDIEEVEELHEQEKRKRQRAASRPQEDDASGMLPAGPGTFAGCIAGTLSTAVVVLMLGLQSGRRLSRG